jgi:hypothetical protein
MFYENNDELRPLATSVKGACRILDCGPTRMNELIKSRVVESYKDGKSRKLVVQSLIDYVARLRAEAAVDQAQQPPSSTGGEGETAERMNKGAVNDKTNS